MKLKRCPFCNSHVLGIDCNAENFWVNCHTCKALGPAGPTRKDAQQLWNGDHMYSNPSALVCSTMSNRNEKANIK